MVSVEDDWDSVDRGEGADKMSSGNCTSNRCFLFAIGYSLRSLLVPVILRAVS